MLSWSKLGGIGNSSIAKITILVPLVGTFIIYNERLNNFAATRMPVIPEAGFLNFAGRVHAQSVEFLYFGLILMGVATFIFQVLSPPQFKTALNPYSYASAKIERATKVPLREDLKELMQSIARYSTASPEILQGEIIIEEIFKSINFSLPGNKRILPDLGRSLAQNGTPSGKLIAISAISNNKILFEALVDGCAGARFDVHYCLYKVKDESMIFARVVTSTLMVLSLMLLLTPTIATTVMILGGLL